MKKLLLILMLPFVLFSYQEERQTQTQIQTPAPQLAECKSGEYGFSIYGDFLYWRPYTEDVTFAIVSISNFPDPATARSIEPKFQWDPGFRIGTSYRTPFDMWKIDFHWTRLYSKAENSIEMTPSFGSTDFVVAPFIHNIGTFFSSAQAAFGMWNLYTNFIDASLSRSIPLTKTICFDPSLGLKVTWINQRLHVLYNLVTIFNGVFPAPTIPQQSATVVNDFWGIGPKLGLGTTWSIVEYFQLFSELGVSFLWGSFDIRNEVTNNFDFGGLSTVLANLDKDRIQIGAEFQIGADLRIPFSWVVFYVRSAYEVQYWWAQSRLVVLDRSFPHGDLTMQGLTLRGGLDF